METITQQNRMFAQDLYQTDDLREWIGLFLHACRSRNLTAGTTEYYAKKLNALIGFCSDIAITEVGQVTPETIRHFLIFLEERNHKPGGVHCYFRAVKAFLKWYEREVERDDWKNPIDRVRAPIVLSRTFGPVHLETIKSMIGVVGATDLVNARDKATLLFLLDSGVRLSEFLTLNKEDVDLITGAVQIRCGKGRKPRLVYMGEKTRQSL